MKAVGSALFVIAAVAGWPARAAAMELTVSPTRIAQGGIAKVTATGDAAADVRGFFRRSPLFFFRVENGDWAALVGVDLAEKSGLADVLVKAQLRSGGTLETATRLRVEETRWGEEKLNVPQAFDQIDRATRARIESERVRLERLWSLATPERLWEGAFSRPIASEMTAAFGLRRVVNGVARSPHGGVDLKAGIGAEIRASNHGRVVLREEFYFSGKSLVLDHGGGLYTMYFHLDDFRVEPDALVRKGSVIGTAGMTGRVTGPHLHWGARLNGARVDPLALLTAGTR